MTKKSNVLLFFSDDQRFDFPNEHILGEALQAEGYRTFETGKWHNGTASYARSFTDGDEIFFGGMGNHWNVPAYHYDRAVIKFLNALLGHLYDLDKSHSKVSKQNNN